MKAELDYLALTVWVALAGLLVVVWVAILAAVLM